MDGRIALIDMDSTLFDYQNQLVADLQKLRSPSETEEVLYYGWKNNPTWLQARIDVVRHQPGWWRNLPRLEIGWQILRACQDVGFCCHILTKCPRSKPVAWMEKVQCINDHLGDKFPVHMVNSGDDSGKDKSNNYGRVLVDDSPEMMEHWLSNMKRGLGIMPAHPWNESFSHQNVFRYSGIDDMPRLRTLLQAAYDREARQHWGKLLQGD